MSASKKEIELQYAMTTNEIAAELGVSARRVRQIEQAALRKLAESGLLDELKDAATKGR